MDPSVDPSQSEYFSSWPSHEATPVSRDPCFKDKYTRDQQFDISWKRNLRHWDYAILDAVQVADNHHHLARKRINSKGNDEGFIIARNEAEILRNVKHRHIVTLYGTYEHGDMHTLLYEPAADHDLRSYLELAESHRNQTRRVNINLGFMTRSFGCLANALAEVHAAGYVHGDIRPENILVHQDRIYLSKFSFGLKSKEDWRASIFGRLSLGKSEGTRTSASTGRPQRQEVRTLLSPHTSRHI